MVVSLREFRRLVADTGKDSTLNGKTKIVKEFFSKHPDLLDGASSPKEATILLHLLLPKVDQRVFSLGTKKLGKV